MLDDFILWYRSLGYGLFYRLLVTNAIGSRKFAGDEVVIAQGHKKHNDKTLKELMSNTD